MRAKTAIVVGAQWGDEGKGKIVDVLSEKLRHRRPLRRRPQRRPHRHHSRQKVRPAAHPLRRPAPRLQGVIGNGVVLDPVAFLNEVSKLKTPAFRRRRRQAALRLQPRAGHPAVPPHDRARRRNAPPGARQSAQRAAASAPRTKTRSTATAFASSTCSTPRCCARTSTTPATRRTPSPTPSSAPSRSTPRQMYEEYARYAEQVAPFVTDTAALLNNALRRRARTSCSRARREALLDIDHGTYPFVTSPPPATAGGAVTGTGVGPTRIGTVIGVTKAYVTRVGEGPFPTEIARRIAATCSASSRQ